MNQDIKKILDDGSLSGVAIREDTTGHKSVNIYSSNEKFYCSGGLGEGFCDDVFQGWVLERPREWIQLAFPWGKEEYFPSRGPQDWLEGSLSHAVRFERIPLCQSPRRPEKDVVDARGFVLRERLFLNAA